ncbi:AsmA family protein [Desulfogranum marinum]|uniref:AsmA family protein n=1 Tax=Desulfogranum marinum TaxID=453220 RepID=UPI0019654822|nr:AsmA family protein [Desulfogranum marinum]MBM9511868.1 AsmA family protein [Desulfogranum marinum]
MKTFFRWLVKGFLVVVVCLVLLIGAVTFFKIPINLTSYKDPVESIISNALHRPVIIDGSIVISTSLQPVFTLKGLQIQNPAGFSQEKFLSLDQARVQIALLPLLQKKLHIPEINVQQLIVTLEENKNGAVNWTFTGDDSAEEKSPVAKRPPEKSKEGAQKLELTDDSIVVEKLRFDNIIVTHYTPGTKEPATFELKECTGSMMPGSPLQLDMAGELLTFPYSLNVSVASIEEFLTSSSTWMEIQAEVADTLLGFVGKVDLVPAQRALALKVIIEGENLKSLDQLLQVDLPPLAKYSVETDLTLQEERFDLKNLAVSTGSSSLVGTATLVREKKVTAEVDFHSPLIQLDDFVFDDWSWRGEKVSQEKEQGEDTEEKTVAKEKTGKEVRNLLDPDLLDDFDIGLTVRADQVLSGEDQLGSGSLKAVLRDGRMAIEPLALQIPGGEITMSTSLKPGQEAADATFRAVVHNFDIGIYVRRQKPESKMSGLVNLDVDLYSSASTVNQIFANGNGYFDFSGHLDNLGAGIIDLWAVNLIAAIVSSTEEEQSEVNCAVGRWKVEDGLLTPDVFFIDTSKIRICGKGQVDFRKNTVNLTVSPTPKKPEFFNLATPLKISGSFDDINFGLRKGALVGTAARFIASPLVVPIKRVFSDQIPEDGSDACGLPLGPDNRSEIYVKGCD